jgi:hypothetical protein
MTSRVQWPGWFAISLPPGWEYEDGGDAITLFDPAGVGAMTVSAAHRVESRVPLTDRDIDTSTIGGVPMAHLSCREAGDHWDLWELLDRDRAVTITYVANAADAEVEREARESIIASFSWLPDVTP